MFLFNKAVVNETQPECRKNILVLFHVLFLKRYHARLSYFLAGKYVGHSFTYVAYFVFLRDVWIRTQRAAVASRRATNLATHPQPT
jgi:hypothetical protein